MSDDERIDHVEYDDSDGELPNKESVISNERKSYEMPVGNTDEKEQLMGNQSETITQLTQNNAEQLKLKQEPQHVHGEANHEQIVNDKNQEIDRKNEENKKFVDHEEVQHINQIQKSHQEHVEEIVYTSNDILNPNNQEVKVQQPQIEDRLQDLQIVNSQLPDSQNQKEQSIEILDQNKKETDKQIHKQAVQDGSNPNNQAQIPHLQNQHHEKAQREEEVHQNRSQFVEKQEKSAQQETNSILDRAIYEQPASQMKVGEDRIQELCQYIQQQQNIEQHKNQPIPHEEQEQKKDPPVQVLQQIISQPKVEPVELKKEEKLESHGAQNDLSLSEQKIKPERRGTLMQNEMTYKNIKGRNNAPPQIQQAATQNAKACKCVIM